MSTPCCGEKLSPSDQNPTRQNMSTCQTARSVLLSTATAATVQQRTAVETRNCVCSSGGNTPSEPAAPACERRRRRTTPGACHIQMSDARDACDACSASHPHSCILWACCAMWCLLSVALRVSCLLFFLGEAVVCGTHFGYAAFGRATTQQFVCGFNSRDCAVNLRHAETGFVWRSAGGGILKPMLPQLWLNRVHSAPVELQLQWCG